MIVQRGFPAAAVVPRGATARRARRPFLRRDHEWLWRDVFLRLARRAGRSLGHRGLHPRLATKPARDAAPMPVGREQLETRATMNALALASRWQRRALISGCRRCAVSSRRCFLTARQFFHSYLVRVAFLERSFPRRARRPHDAIPDRRFVGTRACVISRSLRFRTMPLMMALLFLPVLLGLHDIYRLGAMAARRNGGYHHKAQCAQRAVLHRALDRSISRFCVLAASLASLVARADERENRANTHHRALTPADSSPTSCA